MPPSMRGKFWPALLLLTLAACNSGAIETPGGENEGDKTATAPQRPGGNPGSGDNDEPDYSNLDFPLGDISTNAWTPYIYYQIATRNCAKAESTLERALASGTGSDTGGFLSLGIALCEQDTRTAADLFAKMARPTDAWWACEIYRTAGSVLRDQPKSAFGTCPEALPFTGPPTEPSAVVPVPDEETDPVEPEAPGTEVTPVPPPEDPQPEDPPLEVPEDGQADTPAPAG